MSKLKYGSTLWCVGQNSFNECGYNIEHRLKKHKKAKKRKKTKKRSAIAVLPKLVLCQWSKQNGIIQKIYVGYKFNIFEVLSRNAELATCGFIREFLQSQKRNYIVPSCIILICLFYFDDGNKNYCAAGRNTDGQCGVGHTKQVKSVTKIDKLPGIVDTIFIGINGNTPVWMEQKTNEVFTHGSKSHQAFAYGGRRYSPERIRYEIIDAGFAAATSAPSQYDHNIKCISAACTGKCVIIIRDDNSVWSFGIPSAYHENGSAYSSLTNSCCLRKMEEAFKSIKHPIQSVSAGDKFAMFLSSNGDVHSIGCNTEGQLGSANWNEGSDLPRLINFFADRICIRQVECGMNHSMALSTNCKIYLWGSNKYGQCAVAKERNKVNVPTKLKAPKVKNIKCGAFHSGFGSENNKWYLWGSNSFNECVLYKTKKEINCVYLPKYINDTVKKITNMGCILDVALGYRTTMILIGRPNSLTFQCQC